MATKGGLFNLQTACETSQHKEKIDQWMNEGKSNLAISKLLLELGEKISDKSIGKYRIKRDEEINTKLMYDPNYQKQIAVANQTMADEIGKFKQVNVINRLAETIEHCAELVQQAQVDQISVRNVQDLRYVQMTMLEALKIYGDTVMKAQQMAKIEQDPSLIKPTVNVNVKNVLVDMLGGMSDEQRFDIIDRIRKGTGDNEPR